jgi:hypothetical protein
MSNKRQFRCRSCGDYFTLSDEDNETYEEGYYEFEPDICDDCLLNSTFSHEEDIFDCTDNL